MSAPDAASVMRALAETWPPAQTRSFGAWTARRGDGGGSRVSALTADDGATLDAQFDAACALAHEWGQPLLAQIAPGQGALDSALAAKGWTAADETSLMVAALAAVPELHEADRIIARVRTPLAALDDLWARGGVGLARRAVMARAAVAKERFLIRERERPAGAVFAAMSGDVVMLHALHVEPEFRRSGAGRAAVRAVADWGAAAGAAWIGLAVTQVNHAAIGLYHGMGLRPVGAYRYRRAPER